jgi:hypothetical protein
MTSIVPAIRKSRWRRLLCRNGQRSVRQEDDRWHSRCLDCGSAWCGGSWHHWEIGRQPPE